MFNYKMLAHKQARWLTNKDTCHGPPGFDPSDPHVENKGLTPTSCPLNSLQGP